MISFQLNYQICGTLKHIRDIMEDWSIGSIIFIGLVIVIMIILKGIKGH